MLKKLIKIATFVSLLIAPKICLGMVRTYGADLINDPTLSYSTSAILNLDDIDTLAMQAVYSSASVSAQPFSDGRISTANVTISSYPALSSAPATDYLIVSSNTALAGRFASMAISISSNAPLNTWTAPVTVTLNGSTVTLRRDWTFSDFSTQTARNLATSLNNLGVYAITATTGPQTGSTVTITATLAGSAFNSITVFTSTPALIILSSPTLVGGRDIGRFSLNSSTFIANKNFIVDANFSTQTAYNIATMLNFSSYSVTATTPTVALATGVILTAQIYGSFGNSFALVSSTTALTVGSPLFISGRDPAFLKVIGVQYTNGTDWTSVTNASTTAKNLSDFLMTKSEVSSIISTTWTVAGVIYATSTAINKNNYVLMTSTQFALRLSGTTLDNTPVHISTFSGGLPSQISIAGFISSNTINVSTHGVTTGFPFWWQTISGSTPTPLNTGTTYYAIKVDQNNLKLALTSTGALAGLNIVITSQTITGGSLFQLNPVPLAGSPSFKWQASNDCTTFFDLPISSITFSGAGSTMWDGTINYRCLRLNYTAGTGGGLNFKATGNGKKYYP